MKNRCAGILFFLCSHIFYSMNAPYDAHLRKIFAAIINQQHTRLESLLKLPTSRTCIDYVCVAPDLLKNIHNWPEEEDHARAVYVASHLHDLMSLRLLVRYHARVTLKSDNSYGDTALHYALQNIDNPDSLGAVCLLLLDCGVPVNRTRDSVISPLFSALLYQEAPLCRMLVEHGADVRDYQPLALAASLNNLDACCILLHYEGTLVDEVDEGGKTPLMYAFEHKSHALIDLFIMHGADPYKENAEHKTVFTAGSYRDDLIRHMTRALLRRLKFRILFDGDTSPFVDLLTRMARQFMTVRNTIIGGHEEAFPCFLSNRRRFDADTFKQELLQYVRGLVLVERGTSPE